VTVVGGGYFREIIKKQQGMSNILIILDMWFEPVHF
jgi:hypothetical protein